LEVKPIADIDDRSWLLADVSKKAIQQTRSQVKSLLEGKYSKEKSEDLAQDPYGRQVDHDYPITYEEAKNPRSARDKAIPRKSIS